jgi:hypothetical protein
MTRPPDLGSLVVTLTPHHLFHLLALISDLVVYAGVLRTRLSKFIFLTCSAAFLVRTEDDHVPAMWTLDKEQGIRITCN